METIGIARMPGGYDLEIPVHEIRGRRSGPTVAIIAGQHGNELHSTMAAVEVLKRLDPGELRGRVLIVPVANPVSFDHKERATWMDALHGANTGNLNRLWPGRVDGFITERMAYALNAHVISGADVVLDIHNGTPGGLSIYYGYHYAGDGEHIRKSNELALAFGMEILVEGHAPDVEASPTLGNYVLRELRRPMVIVELGDFYGFDPEYGEKPMQPVRIALDVGVTGILNLVRALDMLPGEVVRPKKQIIISPERRCQPSQGGVMIPRVFKRDIGSVFPGQHVLAEIVDPYTGDHVDDIRTPYDRNLLLSSNSPEAYVVVHAGDQAFHVGDMTTARWVMN